MKSITFKPPHRKLLTVVIAGMVLLTNNQAHAADYFFYDLGTAGGPWSSATAINNSGQITGGNSRGTSTRDDGEILTIWNGITPTTSELSSRGWAINSAGNVAGGYAPNNWWFFPAVWRGNTRTDLDDLGGRAADSSYSVANGINSHGQLVGDAATPDFSAIKPMFWNNSPTATVLNTLGGISGSANGINDSGIAVGDSFVTGDTESHATRWDVNANQAFDLGTLGGTDSSALAINAGGQIVGWSDLAGDAERHATLWDGLSITDLGSLGGTNSRALAINNSGQIVGWSEIADGSQHATLWDGNALVDLNTYLDPSWVEAGWILKQAAGINDHSWIVGTATNSLLGITDGHAFLLSPTAVPVPGAVWLFGSAMAGLIGFGRRKAA